MIVLRDIRKEKGVTIAKLSRLSGVSRATIHKIESGTGEASTKTLKALADALGVSVSAFFVD